MITNFKLSLFFTEYKQDHLMFETVIDRLPEETSGLPLPAFLKTLTRLKFTEIDRIILSGLQSGIAEPHH